MDYTALGVSLFKGAYSKPIILLVLVEPFSRYIYCKITPDQTSANVIKMMHYVIVDFPDLKIIKTDQGTHFTATRVQDEARYLGIRLAKRLSYNPTVQGSVERSNRTLKTMFLREIIIKFLQQNRSLSDLQVEMLLKKTVLNLNCRYCYVIDTRPIVYHNKPRINIYLF